MTRNVLPSIVKKFTPWMYVHRYYARMHFMTWDDGLPYGTEDAMLLGKFCLKGLESWVHVTDRALITTKSNHALSLFQGLMTHKPQGMAIAGGLATNSVLPTDDFCNEKGWDRLAFYAQEIADITGVHEITFDNETSLDGFHNGEEKIDIAQLGQAMSHVRRLNMPVVFYFPRPLLGKSGFADRFSATCDLMRLMADMVPLASFMCNGEANPWYVSDPEARHEQAIMIDLLGLGRLSYRYFVSPASKAADTGWYTAPKRVMNAMKAAPRSKKTLWTGAEDWVRVAEEMAAL